MEPRRSESLTDVRIRQAKPTGTPYKLADGRGLYLLVTAQGSKLWRFDYRFAGKRKTLALGVYPDLSLSQARKRHALAREALAKGNDPAAERKAKREARATLFRDVADRWHAEARKAWSEAHAETVRYRMERYLIPSLGSRPIVDIEPQEMLRVLRPLDDPPSNRGDDHLPFGALGQCHAEHRLKFLHALAQR